jgi:dipeptidyl aminopeptidase/acylaminoacyl peptidase
VSPGPHQRGRPPADYPGQRACPGDGTRLSYSIDTVTKTPYARLSVPARRRAVAAVPPGDPRYSLAERQVRLESDKDSPISWTDDGTTYVYGKDGRIYVGTLDGKAERQIAGPRADTSKTPRPSATTPVPDSVRRRQAKENFTLVKLDPKGAWVLASNSEGFWEIATADSAKQLVVRSDTAAGTPLYRFMDMSRDGNVSYFSGSQRTRWENGIYKYDRPTRALRPLVQDARRYESGRLSRDGSTLIVGVGDGSRPTELYALDATGGSPRQLTKTNARFDDPRFHRTELVSYLDVDGRRQYGVLYYPTDFESGKPYPTILHLYEQFFDEEYEPTDKLLTANGYVVFRPSVPSKADPGYASESWARAATTAANKLIEMGIADSARLGVYGCSYGGFATSLLITQTRRFRAAVEVAGPIDLISLYGDSPRLVLRNMAFSEAKGNYQLNMGATLWEQPNKYIQNSALLFADRITTPLLILSGSQDHNVPVGQDGEMFYSMRRLGKEVEWVNYTHGGHCMPYSSEEDYRDYNTRIVNWFDKYLKKPTAAATTSEK